MSRDEKTTGKKKPSSSKQKKSKKIKSKNRKIVSSVSSSNKPNRPSSSRRPKKSSAVSEKRGKETLRTKSKKKKRRTKKRRMKGIGIELLLTLGISFILFSTALYFTVRIPKVEGYAMTTVLNDRDRLLVNKLGKIERFKMVYFLHPKTGEPTIRRVIGLPGEELFYKNDGLYINNQLKAERFLTEALNEAKQAGRILTEDFTLNQLAKTTRIPEGKYLVLGDNRQFAIDSRNYGLIDKKDIIGVVELRFFPLHTATRF